MASEEIDRLVVSLGLDPTDFTEGGKEAVDALQNLTEEQQRIINRAMDKRRQAKIRDTEQNDAARQREGAKEKRDLEKASRDDLKRQEREKRDRDRIRREEDRADEHATRAAEDRAERVANGIQKITGAALSLLGTFAVGKGLADAMTQLTTADAATGRMATNLGVTPQKLGGLQNALKSIGGSPEAAQAGIGDLVGIGQQIQMTGQSAAIPYLQMAGVTSEDLQNPQRALDKLADYFHRVGPRQASYVGSQMGLPQDLINLMEGGSKKFEAAWSAGLANAPTEADVKTSQDLQAEWNKVDQDFTEFARKLRDELAPAIKAVLELLDQVAKWAQAHPMVAAAAGFGAPIAGKAAAGGLWRLARSLAKKGPAAAAEAAEAESAAETVAAGGSVVLSPLLAGAALAAGIEFYPSTANGGEEKALDKLYPNRPRGTPIAVNNPGNLIVPGKPGVFQNFPTLADGVAAAKAQLLRDNTVHGLKTTRQIINSWAPPSDGNDTSSYVAQVAASLGVSPDAPIDLSDPKTMEAFSKAVFKREGNWYWRHRNDPSQLPQGPATGMSPSDRGVPTGIPLDGLPPSVDSYLATLRHGTAPDAQHGGAGSTSNTSNTTTTHVGEVHVHTAATDADGIAKDMRGAMMRNWWGAQGNTGLA